MLGGLLKNRRKNLKEEVGGWNHSCCNGRRLNVILKLARPMKTKSPLLAVCVFAATVFTAVTASAQWGNPVGFGWGPTMMRPSSYYRFYGSRFGTMGQVKIASDLTYDTKINAYDANLGNAGKRNPYGLIVGSGEVSKLLLTCRPNADRQPGLGNPKIQMPFHLLVASLDIRGVNLSRKDGRFASFEEEVATCGRILVWLDHTKQYLLLDSADPERRRVEWPYSTSVPPERVFVEGVVPTQPGGGFYITMALDDSNRQGLSKLFGEPAVWDRQMISVKQPGVEPKPWADPSPVWSGATAAPGGVAMGK